MFLHKKKYHILSGGKKIAFTPDNFTLFDNKQKLNTSKFNVFRDFMFLHKNDHVILKKEITFSLDHLTLFHDNKLKLNKTRHMRGTMAYWLIFVQFR